MPYPYPYLVASFLAFLEVPEENLVHLEDLASYLRGEVAFLGNLGGQEVLEVEVSYLEVVGVRLSSSFLVEVEYPWEEVVSFLLVVEAKILPLEGVVSQRVVACQVVEEVNLMDLTFLVVEVFPFLLEEEATLVVQVPSFLVGEEVVLILVV